MWPSPYSNPVCSIVGELFERVSIAHQLDAINETQPFSLEGKTDGLLRTPSGPRDRRAEVEALLGSYRFVLSWNMSFIALLAIRLSRIDLPEFRLCLFELLVRSHKLVESENHLAFLDLFHIPFHVEIISIQTSGPAEWADRFRANMQKAPNASVAEPADRTVWRSGLRLDGLLNYVANNGELWAPIWVLITNVLSQNAVFLQQSLHLRAGVQDHASHTH
jgi:hypothetical protein